MEELNQLIVALGALGAIAVFVLNFVMGLAVGADAKRRLDAGRPLAFLGPGAWFLATVLGSFVALALYWSMHYSSFRSATEFPERP